MASEDANRSVADYFVVAGLPKDNPQILDEYSLEVNLKPSAYQDPITDITVIIPSLGECVPDRYQLIDQTPGGHSADLNSGSFRAPEIFVCYRRGRDRAPLLDIGVLYDGKERVTPDSQIVEFTSNGYSANVNNTHNSATYLTYRRATEVSPPNEKVVMDVCVIVTSKGDIPPHAFKVIDKTLNKGMVGSDVYLCYKKSMNRPNLISYKPGLLCRFPLKNHPVYSLEETVALFCMPMGATLECWPSDSSRPAAVKSTFVLTLASREKVYGTAITFYEEYSEDLLTAEQKELLHLNNRKSSERKILANKTICLLSRWPFFEAFKSFLFYLHKKQLMGPFDVPLERFISHFLYDVPFPSSERPRILVQMTAEERIALFQPEELPLPRSGASFRHLLANLGPENCMMVLLLALTEQKILIHSFRPDVLTSVAEAVMQIIFPFYWQCPYIPLCPIGMSDYLAAPLPFIIGLDSRFFDLYDQPEDVNAIDLDTNTVTLANGMKDLSVKLLPKKDCRQLRTSLENLMEKLAHQVKISRELEAHNDGAIDFEFKTKRREMMLDMEIREAFLVFMVNILSEYKSFLLPITAMPTVGATDVNNLFNQSGFLASRDKNYHRFYHMLMRTQMFTKFIEERSFVSDTNASLAFFDECMDHHGDLDHRYLELEGPDSDRTVFILPPDSSGLPMDKEYHYDKFDDLDHDLFEDKSEAVDNQCSLDVFATPASAIARRTKQEIKSAQKSARKHVDNPTMWAKFLVNTTYSLWFIHLPGFMVANKALVASEAKALRLGIVMLARMRRLRLNPIDEICFRVMMQLCGVCQRPQMAMEVLNHMNMMGMVPNAVTYGYYNKVVLESKWPGAKEPSKAVKLWQKLNLILEVTRRFKQCGLEAQSVNSFSRERQSRGQPAASTSLRGSKSELDNVSRSSQESGLSRLSASNEKAAASKEAPKQPQKQPQQRSDDTDSGRVSASEADKLSSNGDNNISASTTMTKTEAVSEYEVKNPNTEEVRKRLSSILKPEMASSPEDIDHHQDSPKKKREVMTDLNISGDTISRLNDLKLDSLGQDKAILDNNDTTPTMASKNITRYSDIRGRFSNLLGTSSTASTTASASNKPLNVNRVLFTSASGTEVEYRDSSEELLTASDGLDDDFGPLKSRSQSVESEDDRGMMMGEAVNTLPTVLEDEHPTFTNSLLTPPGVLHKVASSTSVKLMGVPVTDNDPLGALISPTTSPTTSKMPKSATANDLLVVNNTKRPSLEADNILGAPFAASTSDMMARSSTMPLSEADGGQTKSYFNLSSIKNMTTKGTTKLTTLKKGYLTSATTTTWMSPNSKESLKSGFTSLRSAYSSATTTLSKRVEELRDYQQATPSKVASGGLTEDSAADDDTLSVTSMDSRRPSEAVDQPELWSNLTGQLWDQIWSYGGYDASRGTSQQPQQTQQSAKTFSELFEDLYSIMPKEISGPVAMELHMTSASRCNYCSSILYDEEIIAGWTAEDSNLNTKCSFCSKLMVPFLTVHVVDFRGCSEVKLNGQNGSEDIISEVNVNGDNVAETTSKDPEVKVNGDNVDETTSKDPEVKVNGGNVAETTSKDPEVQFNGEKESGATLNKLVLEPIMVPYLSPLVLRKELENVLEREGDACLGDDDCVDRHPIIYWNLVWFFERIGVNSHLPGLTLRSTSLNKRQVDVMWNEADHRNVAVKTRWDNELFNEDSGVPIYQQFRKKENEANVKLICDGVQNRDLVMPLKALMDQRSETIDDNAQFPPRSLYREMMFVTLESFGQDNIDLTAFDREYRRAFEKLTSNYQTALQTSDRPPTSVVILCRKFFRELKI